jgi:Protein of unknown function (DUF2959)
MADNNPPIDLLQKIFTLITPFFSKKFKNAYYTAKESIGEHKRDIMVREVEQVCVDLQHTRDEFEDALTRFKNVVTVNETPLEQRYNLLNRQYQFCRSKSDVVSNRIKAIEGVSEALFLEWENELNDYSSRSLRFSSKQQLRLARQNYTRLMKAMRLAESKIHPVLAAFKDQVLYLKHNLNAQAISALHHEFKVISIDISQLILAMEHTIAEASLFVSSLVGRQISDQKKALPRPER